MGWGQSAHLEQSQADSGLPPPGTLLCTVLLTWYPELDGRNLIPDQMEELGAERYSISGQALG